MDSPLLAIVGPTATGKSALALRLALELDGEIVSADSRQAYRFMDIGTAKPSPQDRSQVPHHLVDVVDPDGEYSLAVFLSQAAEALRQIRDRGRRPILAGGTGQYVWALLEDWQLPEAPPDVVHRRSTAQKVSEEGGAALYEELTALDPEAAARIDPRNVRRVSRALEVRRLSTPGPAGGPVKSPVPEGTSIIGLTLERAALYERVDARIDRMLEAGWVEEVQALLDRGFSPDLPSMSSLGYREIVRHLAGDMSIAEAAARIKRRTHRFVRQQYNWFRPSDRRIKWFEASPSGLDAAFAEGRRAFGVI